MLRNLRQYSAAAAMLLAAATTAHAGKSNDTLNVVWDREQTTLDVYYFTDHSGLTVMHNVWDGLIYRDPATGQYFPLLATAWDWPWVIAIPGIALLILVLGMNFLGDGLRDVLSPSSRDD